MNSDIVDDMDENKDHEPRADTVLSECTITVATVITTTSTTTVTETVTEEIVEGEIEEKQGVSVSEKVGMEEEQDEGGDVMVEVLGSEVLVDGVTRHGGEVGGDELGGDAGEREDMGNGDGDGGGGGGGDGDGGGGKKMDDSGVVDDGVLGVRQGDLASGGSEAFPSEPGHGSANGNGSSVSTNELVQDAEAHDHGDEKVVERSLDDEGGRKDMGLSGNSNGLHEDSGPQNVEVRSYQIKIDAHHSMSQTTLTADGSKDVDAEQNVESIKNEGDGEDSEVVEHPSTALESRSEESLLSRERDEQGISESNAQGNELLDATVNRGIESVEASCRDDRSICVESAECSSADVNPLRIEDKVVAEEQMQDCNIQTQAKDEDIVHKAGKEEVEVIDSVSRDSETTNPESSDMQTQVSTREKNGNADDVNVVHTDSSLVTKASDDIVCQPVEGQQLDVSTVGIVKDTLKQSADNQELQPETAVLGILDKVSVNEKSEGEIEAGNGSELTTMIRDKDEVSEEPKDYAEGAETGIVSKATALTSEKVSENDEEVQCCGNEMKLVAYPEVDQNMKTEPVKHADMRSSDESSLSYREEAGKIGMKVEDSVPKSEILHSVEDGKSNDCNGSSDPSAQNNVLDAPVVAAVVDDKSGAVSEMKDVEGNGMEIDDATQCPDHSENQKVYEKIKLDGTVKNGDPQLECIVEGTSVVGMDIDAVDANSEEQGKDCADHQNGLTSNSDMIVENQDSEAVLYTDSRKGTTAADENPRSTEEVAAVSSLYSTKEVMIGCKSTLDSASSKNSFEPVSSCVPELAELSPGQSKNVNVQVVSLVNASEVKEETTGLSNPVSNAILGQEVIKAEDKIHKTDERLNIGSPILEREGPDVSIAASTIADSDVGPRQDTPEESEGLATHEQPPLTDESLVNCVDHGLECEPDTSAGERLGTNSTDCVAKVGPNVENSQEQEQAANTDVPIAGSIKADSDASAKQDTCEEPEGHTAYEQSTLPNELPDKCVDKGLECEQETSPGECLDKNATDGDLHPCSNMEDNQEMQELAANTIVSNAGSTIADLDADCKQDKSACEQPPLSEESLVKCVDQSLECEPDSSLGECLNKNVSDGFAQVGSYVEDIQEMQERSTNAEEVVSLEAVAPGEENMIHLQDPVTSVVMDKQVIHAGDSAHEVEEKFNMSTTPISDIEVPDVLVAGSTVADLSTDPKQDGKDEFEGLAAHEQPIQDESFVEGTNQGLECEPATSLGDRLDKSATDDVAPNDTNMEETVEEREEAAFTEQVESPGEQEVEDDPVSDSAKPRSRDDKSTKRGSAKPGSFVRDRVSYELPPENEGEFSVFDLVWGKVKSHPWWPGQIFHPSDSSEKAMKYYRKDCYLVAYFGDQTFAWNEASVLKPFRKHFSQEERQNNSESFRNAVNCALVEVSRRVELGLACSCIPEAVYDKIKYQLVENAGIREESSKREGVDRSSGPDTLQPGRLLDYVRALAVSTTTGADRLDLVIAKAQLSAFYRLKGCDALPDFEYYEGLMECDADNSLPGEQRMSCEGELADSAAGGDGTTRSRGPHKRKHNLKDIVYQRRKEKSLTELMGETMYYLDGEFDSHEEDDIMLGSPTSGLKRKASGYPMDDFTAQQSTKTISFAKVSQTASPNPQQSFKVGECIRRVASQLTGSPSIIKSASDGSNSKHLGDDADEVLDTPDESLTDSTMIPQKQSSPEDMLSQLHLSARDPMKGYSFFADIISFFSEFRNMAVSTQRQQMRKGAAKKRKPSVPAVGTPGPETFEFDDRNDSYWTDMVIQNNSEAKSSRRGRKRKDDQLVSVDPEKRLQSNPRKYSRKQYFHGNHEPASGMPSGDEKKQDQLPTELMLNFSDVGSIPSEVNLNKMFRRFGPLKESETEVDSQSSRARVVFKKRSDAEVAYSSAAMFNIFGSTLVNYQLNYTPSVSFGTSTLALSDTLEHAT